MAFKLDALKLPLPPARRRSRRRRAPRRLLGRLAAHRAAADRRAAADPHRPAGPAAADRRGHRRGRFAPGDLRHHLHRSVGKIQMLSQRLAKAAQQASQGNAEAFKQLREQPRRIRRADQAALRGGEQRRGAAAHVRRCARRSMDSTEWTKTERNATLVLGEERNLIGARPRRALDQQHQPGRCRSSPTRFPR